MRKVIFLAAIIEAAVREDFKKSAITQLRSEGKFPANLYGKTTENRNISVDYADFIKLMREVGRNGIFNVKVEGDSQHAVMLHDIDTDPLKDMVIHADFFVVDMSSEVDVHVPVHLVGDAVGVRDGGVMQQPLHEVSIRALPGSIPDYIQVDVTNLDVNEAIHISDLKTSKNYEITLEDDEVVATILPPKVEEVVDSGEVQNTEPELVREADAKDRAK
jgi:large subunit ribosomal protein L25